MSTATYQHFSGSAAEAYEAFFVPTIATPVSRELLHAAALRPGETVLDVACGTGVIARHAAAAVGPTGSVTGTDLAPDMIAVAEATDRPDGATIEWRQANAESLPLADETFDAVLCQMGLMFMENKTGALAEMHRVLKPGGRAVINTPGRIQPVFEHLERAIVDHISPDLGVFVRAVFSMPDPATLGGLLTESGFTGVETSGYLAELDLPAPAEFLWQYINLSPMAPLVAQASDTAKAALEQQFVEACDPLVVDDRVAIEQPAALALARRP